MKLNYIMILAPILLVASILPVFLNSVANSSFIPILRIILLLTSIFALYIFQRKQDKTFLHYYHTMQASFGLLTFSEILRFVYNFYPNTSIYIAALALSILSYICIYVLLVIRIRQNRPFIARSLLLILMTVTLTMLALFYPLNYNFLKGLFDEQLYTEFAFMITRLIIYADMFTLTLAFLYTTRKMKASLFWTPIFGGLMFLLIEDIFYKYFIVNELYYYGSTPDILRNLTYAVWVIGYVYIIEKKVGSITVMELEQEKTHYQELYMEINNLATDLMNVTSLFRHDLLNDLAVMQSSLEVYQDTNENKFLVKIDDRIQVAIQRVRNLGSTSGVLKSLRTQPLQVNSISDVIKIFENVEFEPIAEDVYVEFSTLLYPIIINLIQNSFQHGGKDTKVQVEATQQDQKVIIRIKDNGTGISNEDKKNVFNKEFRKSNKGVSGMGLFLIRNITERFDGHIFVEDNNPKGAIFSLELPISQSET